MILKPCSIIPRLGVGLLGAGGWSAAAHAPAYRACDRARLVAVCDTVPERARALAERFGIERVYRDHRELLADPDVQMVDICTATDSHAPLSRAAIEAGKHVLCEKPLADDTDTAFDLARQAASRGVRTKVAFTFRYSAVIRQLLAWIEDGTIGEVFHIHGLEQNAQFLDPGNPLRQVPADPGTGGLLPSSVVEYGSHLVDLMRACGGEVETLVSSMHNFVPERLVRGREGMQRIALEDATVALVEFVSGAHGMLQTSHIAIGQAPGVEIRVYGSKAAAVARLVAEGDILETLHLATAEAPTLRRVEIAADAYPQGATGAPWPQRYFMNLVRHFVDEILDEGQPECTFADAAAGRGIVDAIIRSHEQRRWVSTTA